MLRNILIAATPLVILTNAGISAPVPPTDGRAAPPVGVVIDHHTVQMPHYFLSCEPTPDPGIKGNYLAWITNDSRFTIPAGTQIVMSVGLVPRGPGFTGSLNIPLVPRQSAFFGNVGARPDVCRASVP